MIIANTEIKRTLNSLKSQAYLLHFISRLFML